MACVESTIPGIHDGDVNVRITTLTSLKQVATREDLSPVVMDLTMHLGDESPEVRDLALGTLIIYARSTNNSRLLERMRGIVGGPCSNDAQKAAIVLRFISERLGDLAKQGMQRVRQEIVSDLSLTKSDIDTVMKLRRAIEELHGFVLQGGDVSSHVLRLAGLLRHEDSDVSAYAAWTLKSYVSKSAKLIHSSDLTVLGEILEIYLKDDERPLRPLVKTAATETVGMIAEKLGTAKTMGGVLSTGTIKPPSGETTPKKLVQRC